MCAGDSIVDPQLWEHAIITKGPEARTLPASSTPTLRILSAGGDELLDLAYNDGTPIPVHDVWRGRVLR